MEESIYNIIPPEIIKPKKGKMFRSSFPSNVPPTGSTFGTQSVAISIKNLSGMYRSSGNRYSMESGIFGKPKTEKLSPIKAKIMGTNSMDAWIEKGSLVKSELGEVPKKKLKLKPLVPKHEEKPTLGLKSTKNFIATNAIEVILAINMVSEEDPKQKPQEVNWLSKTDFGQVPLYLSQIKEALNSQYEMEQEAVRREQELRDSQIFMLPEDELEQIRVGLKMRYDEVNRLYQLQTHQKIFDTIGMKRRKEMYEKELIQLEKDIAKINKRHVLVQR